MPSLSDHINHLAFAAKSVKSTATAICSQEAGPFVHAVLQTALGDSIRDIDSSELGLFTLVAPTGQGGTHAPEMDAKGVPRGEISRVEFHGATPLRKPPPRRDDSQKVTEYEPEVYAQAALKYLDRYHSTRPMPRARAQIVSIASEIAKVRANIEQLNIALETANSSHFHASSSESVDDEEIRVQNLQNRIAELRRKKESMLQETRQTKLRTPQKKLPIQPSSLEIDVTEETFWNTPATAGRTLRFKDNLMDEQVDLTDVSMVSFGSPGPQHFTATSPNNLQNTSDADVDKKLTAPLAASGQLLSAQETTDDKSTIHDTAHMDVSDEDDEDEDEDEKTIVLKKTTVPSAEDDFQTVQPPFADDPDIPITPAESTIAQRTPTSARKSGIRITSETERITAKIWSSVGEIIMPGHPFDVTGIKGNQPPRAKGTIEHLQSLSMQMPPPLSPSTASLSSVSITTVSSSSQPTTQQILIAHLLIALLSSKSEFSLPLNKLKEILSEKLGVGASTGQGATRAIYGCVAKKLIKIDRGGGEQVVKFDV